MKINFLPESRPEAGAVAKAISIAEAKARRRTILGAEDFEGYRTAQGELHAALAPNSKKILPLPLFPFFRKL
jgi:hypothetical protein